MKNYNKDLKELEKLINNRVVAIGEIGLDYYYDPLDKERQNQLIRILNRKAQTIITTATIADVEPSVLSLARLLELKERGE